MDRHLRFGAFLAPYHEPRENPTLALERDLDLIAHLDRLGFDEAWVGGAALHRLGDDRLAGAVPRGRG